MRVGMRYLSFLVLLSACGGSVATVVDAGATDAATTVDTGTAPDAGLSAFCSGDKPKMEENGKDNPVISVKGKAIVMNCCNAAGVSISTSQHAAIFNLRWQQYGAGPSPVVLGAKTTSVELALGCDPTTTTCTDGNSVEYFDDGFSGTITYEYVKPNMKVGYCVEVKETKPHVLIHSLRMWLPNVDSP